MIVFRHGQSGYAQGNHPCSLEDANDLCAKPVSPDENLEDRQARAVAEVRASALRLAETLDDGVPITIISSPAGRTLHTAKIICDVLNEQGFYVEPIKIEEDLGEVRNFSWDLFAPLIYGGPVTYDDNGPRTFEVDKAETNPFNHEYPQYFVDDNAHHISSDVKQKWPEAYRSMVECFEKFSSVTDRFLGCMEKVAQAEFGHFILVTHDCAAMYLAMHYTNRRQMGLTPGSYLSIIRRDGRLLVTRVDNLTDGDSETDFFALRREYNKLCEQEMS